MFGAYTLKKIVPKLLVGVILINLSFYLVVGAFDLTRVTANGLGRLITGPFVESDSYNYTLGDSISGTQTAVVVPLVGYGIYKATALPGTFNEMFQKVFRVKDSETGRTGLRTAAGRGQADKYLHALLFLVVIPIGLIFLAIMVTLVFRQGILILLAITAPIACVLYILPGTERYFKKWLELFAKTLLMYPLIMLMFAVSDILASIIFNNNEGSLPGLIAGVIAMIAPLGLIPYAFKMSGGAMAGIYGAVQSGRGMLNDKVLKGTRERAAINMKKAWTQARADTFRKADERLNNEDSPEYRTSRWGRRRSALVKGAIGQGIYRKEGELNKREQEEIAFEQSYGDDTRIRAATAVWRKDPKGSGKWGWYDSAGKKYAAEQVKSARRSIGTDQYALQQMLAYGINKATLEDEIDNFDSNLPAIQKEFGMTNHGFNSALIGAGFQMKAKDLHIKRESVETDASGNTTVTLDLQGFLDEDHTTAGTYESLARGHGHVKTLTMGAKVVMDELAALEAIPAGSRTAEQQTKILNLREDLKKLKQRAATMQSQISAAGGITQAYNQAMLQTGQEPPPGGSAAVTEAWGDFLTLMGGVNMDTGQRAETVKEVLDITGGTARRRELREEARRIKAALAAPGGGGLNSMERLEAENRLRAIAQQRIQISKSAVDTLSELANIEQKAIITRRRRGYGKIKVG